MMNVLMPQLGETVSEGKVIKWFKTPGDAVAVGDNLCEIETDKVTVEVPAIAAGVLRAINVQVGDVAPVGAIIAVVGDSAAPESSRTEAVGAPPAAATAPSPVVRTPAAPVSTPQQDGRLVLAERRADLDPFHEVMTPPRTFGPARLDGGITVTPWARRLAVEGAIDLARLSGTGSGGRITGKDVETAIAGRQLSAPSLGEAESSDDLIGPAHRDRPHTVVVIDGMRRTIARRLVEAKTTIPHFYLSRDIAVDRLSRLRDDINAGAPKNSAGTAAYRLSFTDLMIKALALALQRVPRANAIWSRDGILAFQHSDVAVAVALADGLLTPVVTAAETKAPSAISGEMKALAARARERVLQPREYQGGSTTISNLGMHGVREFAAIINPPQSTILAVGAARREAVEAEDGGVKFIGSIAATLSCDHRVVDGAVGAQLLESFAELIENPLQMLA